MVLPRSACPHDWNFIQVILLNPRSINCLMLGINLAITWDFRPSPFSRGFIDSILPGPTASRAVTAVHQLRQHAHWLLFLWRWAAFSLQTLLRATLLLAILNLSWDVVFVVHYQMLISLSDIRTTPCFVLDFLSVSLIILSTLITLFFSVFLRLLSVTHWLIPSIFLIIFFPYFLFLQNALPEPSSWQSKLASPVIFPTLSIFKRFKSNSFPKFWFPR